MTILVYRGCRKVDEHYSIKCYEVEHFRKMFVRYFIHSIAADPSHISSERRTFLLHFRNYLSKCPLLVKNSKILSKKNEWKRLKSTRYLTVNRRSSSVNFISVENFSYFTILCHNSKYIKYNFMTNRGPMSVREMGTRLYATYGFTFCVRVLQ